MLLISLIFPIECLDSLPRQIFKRNSYLQSSTPSEANEQQLQETVRSLENTLETIRSFFFTG